MTPAVPAGPRVLLLVPARTYRAADFLLAAARMGLDLVIGSDGALPLGGRPGLLATRTRQGGNDVTLPAHPASDRRQFHQCQRRS
jgi:hypothetical protein